jgi:hypothetical protein
MPRHSSASHYPSQSEPGPLAESRPDVHAHVPLGVISKGRVLRTVCDDADGTGSPTPRPADGYMGSRLAGTLGSLFGTVVAVIPVVLGAVLTGSDPAVVRMPVLVLCAAGYGIALAWIGVRIAARVAEQRLPDLYQIAIRSKL